ncbi:Long-chain-fatty-acid--CoA ligase [hydrothermal vent metagenome]|uniref:Long-chain-fatty-acid--CoA ligase n=1 Tax=hydrothermal vent metagenome TaxID=652676 RepID=A0A3B1C3R7_9ZZZZ
MTWKTLTQTWHYVEKWAHETPNVEALVFKEQRLSWSEFKTEMDKIALAYLDIGVQKGDRVAFLAMAQIGFMTTYMAANKVGAIWVGLNPKFTLEELRYQIADSQPTVIITLRSFMGNDLSEKISALMHEFPFIKKTLVIGDAFPGTENFNEFVNRPRESMAAELEERVTLSQGDDRALLMYTSGSTGKPKGVVHTHKSIIENIKVEVQKFYIHNKTRGLLHFPINHVAADVEIGFAIIMVGGCNVMMDSFHPVESLKVIELERITLLGQVPVMFLLQMKQPQFKETDFSHVEQFVWSGAAAPKIMVDVLGSICKKTGASLITGYGSTEVCGFVTYTEIDDDMDRLMNSAGKIAEPFELKIVDESHHEIPDGEIGEIAVRGQFMFKEYLNKPDETAAAIDDDGWYYTNDLARKDLDGYIYITGRKSEMFKSGGENVYPREIEEVLESHQGVLFAAVIGVPDKLFQEVGWAFIMRQPGTEVTEEELAELCKERLANFKVPKKFFLRSSLPLLPTGKVNKTILKQEIKDLES